jgi:hypothetical protein
MGLAMSRKIDEGSVRRLIGATRNFKNGARLYLADLEGQAIPPLEFSPLSKGDRDALELSSNVIRPLFDELVDTFVEPYRETVPAKAARGYRILWAALKAASIIGAHTVSETKRIEEVRRAQEEEAKKEAGTAVGRSKRKERADALYEVVKAIMSREPHLSAERIAPKVRAELSRLGYETDKGTSISTIKGACKKVRTGQC